MKVFFSWSGTLSKSIASVFYKWLPSVLQNVRPYLSAEDIDKGDKWLNNISHSLEETSIGLVFVTKENVTAPWINYETGALSNSLKASNVCPILIDLQKGEIDSRNPLFHYQATAVNDKDDIFKLLKTINNQQQADMKVSDEALKQVFEWGWPTLNSELDRILQSIKQSKEDVLKTENESETSDMEEILALLRSIKKDQKLNLDNDYNSKYMTMKYQELENEIEMLNKQMYEVVYENAILKAKYENVQKENKIKNESNNIVTPSEKEELENKYQSFLKGRQ